MPPSAKLAAVRLGWPTSAVAQRGSAQHIAVGVGRGLAAEVAAIRAAATQRDPNHRSLRADRRLCATTWPVGHSARRGTDHSVLAVSRRRPSQLVVTSCLQKRKFLCSRQAWSFILRRAASRAGSGNRQASAAGMCAAALAGVLTAGCCCLAWASRIRREDRCLVDSVARVFYGYTNIIE